MHRRPPDALQSTSCGRRSPELRDLAEAVACRLCPHAWRGRHPASNAGGEASASASRIRERSWRAECLSTSEAEALPPLSNAVLHERVQDDRSKRSYRLTTRGAASARRPWCCAARRLYVWSAEAIASAFVFGCLSARTCEYESGGDCLRTPNHPPWASRCGVRQRSEAQLPLSLRERRAPARAGGTRIPRAHLPRPRQLDAAAKNSGNCASLRCRTPHHAAMAIVTSSRHPSAEATTSP